MALVPSMENFGGLAETGLAPEADMLRDCQGSYTPAKHLRFTQRLNQLPQEGA